MKVKKQKRSFVWKFFDLKKTWTINILVWTSKNDWKWGEIERWKEQWMATVINTMNEYNRFVNEKENILKQQVVRKIWNRLSLKFMCWFLFYADKYKLFWKNRTFNNLMHFIYISKSNKIVNLINYFMFKGAFKCNIQFKERIHNVECNSKWYYKNVIENQSNFSYLSIWNCGNFLSVSIVNYLADW